MGQLSKKLYKLLRQWNTQHTDTILNINVSIKKINISVCVFGGDRGVMVIVAGYGHGDTSSNPGPH